MAPLFKDSNILTEHNNEWKLNRIEQLSERDKCIDRTLWFRWQLIGTNTPNSIHASQTVYIYEYDSSLFDAVVIVIIVVVNARFVFDFSHFFLFSRKSQSNYKSISLAFIPRSFLFFRFKFLISLIHKKRIYLNNCLS